LLGPSVLLFSFILIDRALSAGIFLKGEGCVCARVLVWSDKGRSAFRALRSPGQRLRSGHDDLCFAPVGLLYSVVQAAQVLRSERRLEAAGLGPTNCDPFVSTCGVAAPCDRTQWGEGSAGCDVSRNEFQTGGRMPCGPSRADAIRVCHRVKPRKCKVRLRRGPDIRTSELVGGPSPNWPISRKPPTSFKDRAIPGACRDSGRPPGEGTKGSTPWRQIAVMDRRAGLVGFGLRPRVGVVGAIGAWRRAFRYLIWSGVGQWVPSPRNLGSAISGIIDGAWHVYRLPRANAGSDGADIDMSPRTPSRVTPDRVIFCETQTPLPLRAHCVFSASGSAQPRAARSWTGGFAMFKVLSCA